jgi:hypothetical protein
MKYIAEMASGVMIYKPTFVEAGSGIHRHTDSTVIS